LGCQFADGGVAPADAGLPSTCGCF
jgi:hypothetical protein